MFDKKTSRRNFLQQGSATALAFAAGTRVMPAFAERTGDLNIYCWEGYNSDNVVDPFRRETGGTIRTEALTSDPDAVNRLRAGETKIWDIINVNNPWARNILYPENLIVPLDKSRFEPMYESMLPRFHPPFKWAMSHDGEELLGMVQRFGPFAYAVNTDKISAQTAEDEGWDMFLDPSMKGKYGMLTYDDWNIAHMCMVAGFSPYIKHTKDQIAKFAEVAKQIIDGTKLFSDDLTQINLAMINGEIDACFSGGTYSVSSARYDGATNILGITPKSGPVDGKGGIVWMEITSLVNNPDPSTLAPDFLAYVQRPDVSKNVAFAEGTYNPVSNMSNPDVLNQFDADELDAIQWETLEADVDRCIDYDINPDLAEMHEIYLALRRERQGG